ncbi:MAG TPA: dihydroorotate dehydrogenase [Deltaproteobacteria bacterium]|jgi:dihydroorotate dehydrogenase (NAD+) catalytic subunit|nr:dihydroorotate dehydrogenase [Deltaproteobacteria bacterium]HOI06531.1 dihydroorotate dehydrogenase [Deltaproteobacteria bacterium]
MDTTVRITKDLVLKNPVLSASGTFAYGEEFSRVFDLSLLGAVVTKGLSLNPKEGNPLPRVYETPCGMINAIGLENVGADVFLTEKLPLLQRFGTPVIVNFFGQKEEDYAALAAKLDVDGVAAIEMNVSCPNVSKGGLEFGRDPGVLKRLTAAVRSSTGKPLIVKLSPMVSDIGLMALAAQDGGADALTCSNTLPAMAIDEQTWRPVLGNVTGGLSGPAIKPVALKIVWEVSKRVSIPIIASGGACTWNDCVQFLLAGASAVEIGSASLRDPLCFETIVTGIESYLKGRGLASVTDLIGKLKTA